MPYALRLADRGYSAAITQFPGIAAGANIIKGTITHRGVAEAFGKPYEPVYEVLKN